MQLTEKEFEDFITIYLQLIMELGIKKKLLSKQTSLNDFFEINHSKKNEIRDILYEDISFIDGFVETHAEKLQQPQIEILDQLKHFKKGTFYLMKKGKRETLFMNEEGIYSVCALHDPFYVLFEKMKVPIIVETVLLPFNGKIIYDYFIQPIQRGLGEHTRLMEEFKRRKEKEKIIKKLI